MGYQEQATSTGTGLCSFAKRLIQLNDDDTAAVLDDLGNPYVSDSEVWRKLRLGRTDGEIAVGYRAVGDHRKEYCACVAL